jgi:hypothetical protein
MIEILLDIVYGYLIISAIIFVATFIFLPRAASVFHQFFGAIAVALLWFWLIVAIIFERNQRKRQRKMAGEE